MMTLADAIFAAIAVLTLCGAFLAVWLKNVFYNALSLILCLFGVACLFIYLNGEFLAVMEVIIYIGAISIAIIFAIMLSRPMIQKYVKRNPFKVIRSAAVAGSMFAGLALMVLRTHWPAAPVEGDYSIRSIGKSLLLQHLLPFEVVSLVLLVAIIGALLMSDDREGSR